MRGVLRDVVAVCLMAGLLVAIAAWTGLHSIGRALAKRDQRDADELLLTERYCEAPDHREELTHVS